MAFPRADDEAIHHEDVLSSHKNSNSGNEKEALDVAPISTGARLNNPLAGMTREQVIADVEAFVSERCLEEHRDDFIKGALVAQVNNQPGGFETIDLLSEEDKYYLRREETHRWSQPFRLYFLCTLCAGCAIVQGMDQTAVNGAQLFYFDEWSITNIPFLNKYLGRRGIIFTGCAFSLATGFWMAVCKLWHNFIAARSVLGFAVGPMSSTTPVYSAESTPKNIRGALTMMWQMWTAFGIAVGMIISVAFKDCDLLGENSQWRWIMASTSVPPLIVMCQVYFCPESPRWYMEKGRFDKANPRLYYAGKLLDAESKQREGHKAFKEFFTVRRSRRAAQSAWFCIFMQQFCGVNVIANYSTSIFEGANYGRTNALLISMGAGLINWLFAIPAVYTIDTFGCCNLLLITFPLMSLFLFFTAFSFMIPNQQSMIGCVTTGLSVFMACYSPGICPVPFTYSAEAFPLHVPNIGMVSSTSITWCFNFIISLTWPPLRERLGDSGGFCYYAAWNLFGWVMAYFFLPETRNLTLEELDSVFAMRNRDHAGYYLKKLPWYLKYLLFQDVALFPPLYENYLIL
ncbi:MFS domain-containing protein [Fusarium sp. Ph1]|nr:MFS domain-containing protein [Fusarium sp. Ph1]